MKIIFNLSGTILALFLLVAFPLAVWAIESCPGVSSNPFIEEVTSSKLSNKQALCQTNYKNLYSNLSDHCSGLIADERASLIFELQDYEGVKTVSGFWEALSESASELQSEKIAKVEINDFVSCISKRAIKHFPLSKETRATALKTFKRHKKSPQLVSKLKGVTYHSNKSKKSIASDDQLEDAIEKLLLHKISSEAKSRKFDKLFSTLEIGLSQEGDTLSKNVTQAASFVEEKKQSLQDELSKSRASLAQAEAINSCMYSLDKQDPRARYAERVEEQLGRLEDEVCSVQGRLSLLFDLHTKVAEVKAVQKIKQAKIEAELLAAEEEELKKARLKAEAEKKAEQAKLEETEKVKRLAAIIEKNRKKPIALPNKADSPARAAAMKQLEPDAPPAAVQKRAVDCQLGDFRIGQKKLRSELVSLKSNVKSKSLSTREVKKRLFKLKQRIQLNAPDQPACRSQVQGEIQALLTEVDKVPIPGIRGGAGSRPRLAEPFQP